MFIRNGNRINIHAAINVDGIQYPAGALHDASLRAQLGITETPDPARGDERYYINQEINESPWLIVSPKPIDDVKRMVLDAINGECEQRMSQIRASYPESEILSWPKQETEARAYLASPEGDYPLLRTLATTRQIDVAELADRIVQKSDAYAMVSGQVIGTRQRLEDALDGLPEDADIDDVIAIQWPVSDEGVE